jgi:hypothetical protein
MVPGDSAAEDARLWGSHEDFDQNRHGCGEVDADHPFERGHIRLEDRQIGFDPGETVFVLSQLFGGGARFFSGAPAATSAS